MSPLLAHQSDVKPRGFPGHVPTSSACLPRRIVAGTVTAVDTSTPFVAAPAPIVEQPGMHAREFLTLRLSESPELLSSFRLSSSSPMPTLGSSRGLFAAFFAQPCSSARGVLLPMTLDNFDDSVLGDPITYVRCEKFPRSESPLSLPVYAWPSGSAFLLDPAVLQTVLA